MRRFSRTHFQALNGVLALELGNASGLCRLFTLDQEQQVPRITCIFRIVKDGDIDRKASERSVLFPLRGFRWANTGRRVRILRRVPRLF